MNLTTLGPRTSGIVHYLSFCDLEKVFLMERNTWEKMVSLHPSILLNLHVMPGDLSRHPGKALKGTSLREQARTTEQKDGKNLSQ